MCQLCAAKKISKRYYEEADFWIANCANKTCGLPMIVLRSHKMVVSLEIMKRMIEKAEEIFGGGIKLRCNQRAIPDHYHVHIIN